MAAPEKKRSCQYILVVEDDSDIRDSIREILESEGYSVMTAVNGKEAIHFLKTVDNTCLVLLDLMMAVMNGWQFLEVRKHDTGLATIPVVVVSAIADQKAKDAGATSFIRKPVDLDMLLKVVQQYAA